MDNWIYKTFTFANGDVLHLPARIYRTSEEDGLQTFVRRYADVIDWVDRVNPSTKAYHSTKHLVGVGFIVYELARMQTVKWSDRHIDRLVHAALLHDIAHPGLAIDSENIKATIAFIETTDFFERFDSCASTVKRYIEATVWPAEKDRVFTERESILRDADQIYANYFMTPELSKALSTELGPKSGISKYAEWMEHNVDYLLKQSNTLLTTNGQQLYERGLSAAIMCQVTILARECQK